MKLFEIEEKKDIITNTCRTCEHRQRWECGSKIIQYCAKRKSNRTDNGLLKIRAKDTACFLYEVEKNN